MTVEYMAQLHYTPMQVWWLLCVHVAKTGYVVSYKCSVVSDPLPSVP